ncbi:hypothetical protein, partial [Halomonas sp. 707B3]|uniref:hypothetical protein n=1 Tax=Halomonas sp. 707B3 TaxID=1681043 RepID=UPI00209CC7AD
STGYMSRGGLAGAVDSKTFSLCLALKRVDTGTHVIFDSRSSSSLKVLIDFNATNEFNVQMWNHSGTKVFQSSNLNTIVDAGSWFVLQMSVDLSDTAKRSLYINNQQMSPNWSTYINDFIDFTNDASVVGRYGSNSSYYINGDLSFTYFTTDYIDFSQESERLKFVDAFGYPVDIRPKIESGEIPTPLIYMPFDDPNDLGKNLGTGGDFTVNGTVVPGSDVSPA